MTAPPKKLRTADRLHGLTPTVAALLRDAMRHIERGHLDAAERAMMGALALAPTHAETLRLCGLVEHRRGRLGRAGELYRQALEMQADDAMLLAQFGELKVDMGDVAGGLALLRRSCEAAPTDADAWLRFGLQLDRQGLHEEALVAGRHILDQAPAHAVARLLIARNLQALGRVEETAAECRTLIAQGGPRAYQAWFTLVDLKTTRLEAREVLALEKLARDPRLADDARATLDFALGKVHEDGGRHIDALHAFRRANAAKRRDLRWDSGAFSRGIDAIREAFAQPLTGAVADLGREVVFVVGMPRSSTTLIEQILAAHPDVEGASELSDLPAVLEQESARRGIAFPRWVAAASTEDWTRLGRDYLARTARWRQRRPRSTDKLPDNWRLVDAIRLMLPAAKIIDCRRDALETCWSCYKQMFAPTRADYSYAFGDLAAYWRDCTRFGDGSARRYPQHVRVQGYEALLAAPESQIRALLDFCQLPFDPACLQFHTAERAIRTPSVAQVRRPLDAGTVRAARYGDLLADLRDRLA
jgi:tetratricopeptide (TPR) repeat protein